MKNRNILLRKNIVYSIIFQCTSVICGFVVPRLILSSFGSDINGLVSSITQFLSMITFMEMGVGAVVESALYKPLADRDEFQISRIMVSASKFFRRLAKILLVYVMILVFIFPCISNSKFDFLYTATLIAVLAVSSFSEYYFGITEMLLLRADQRAYIQYNIRTITLIVNTLSCIVLINLGSSIQVVKLATALIYLVRPLTLRLYVDRHYNIDRKITYSKEPIEQKWNGVAQHIAAIVHSNTDQVVLTIFSTFTNVSIYSVYYLVVNGVKTLFLSMSNGFKAIMGELWAKKDYDELKHFFGWVEWCSHIGTTLIFGFTASLIVPFILIYTNNINDANYYTPIFAIFLVLAYAVEGLRLPYATMILAAGYYKQTQSCYIITAILNIVISIVVVFKYGLIGVTVGTLISLIYQVIWMVFYNQNNLVQWPASNFFKHLLVDIVTFIVSFLTCKIFILTKLTYIAWIKLAIKCFIVWSIVVFAMNFVFYKDRMFTLIEKVLKNKGNWWRLGDRGK